LQGVATPIQYQHHPWARCQHLDQKSRTQLASGEVPHVDGEV
jgi:hypothetical protein